MELFLVFLILSVIVAVPMVGMNYLFAYLGAELDGEVDGEISERKHIIYRKNDLGFTGFQRTAYLRGLNSGRHSVQATRQRLANRGTGHKYAN